MATNDVSGAVAAIAAKEKELAQYRADGFIGSVVESEKAAEELRGTHSTGFDRAAQALLSAISNLTAWIKANVDTHSGRVVDYQADDPKAPRHPLADASWAGAKFETYVKMVRSSRKRSSDEPLENTTFVEFEGVNNLANWHTGDAKNKRTGEVGTFVAHWVMDSDMPELSSDGRVVVIDGKPMVMPRLAFFHFLKEDADMEALQDLFTDVRRAGGSVKDYRQLEEDAVFEDPSSDDGDCF